MKPNAMDSPISASGLHFCKSLLFFTFRFVVVVEHEHPNIFLTVLSNARDMKMSLSGKVFISIFVVIVFLFVLSHRCWRVHSQISHRELLSILLTREDNSSDKPALHNIFHMSSLSHRSPSLFSRFLNVFLPHFLPVADLIHTVVAVWHVSFARL